MPRCLRAARLDDGRVDQRREHDRPLAVARAGFVDARRGFARLVGAVDEGQPLRPVAQVLELRQHAVAQCLGGDSGAVRDKENGAIVNGSRRGCDIARMLAGPPLHCARFPQRETMQRGKYVIPFSQLRMTDVESVGGKNASLGEMLSQLSAAGVRVPDGFATTAEAFPIISASTKTCENASRSGSARLNVEDVRALAAAGNEIRELDRRGAVSGRFETEIRVYISGRLSADSSSEISVRRALQRDGRRPAGRFICRPAGNVS